MNAAIDWPGQIGRPMFEIADILAIKIERLLEEAVLPDEVVSTMAECEQLAGQYLNSHPRRTSPLVWSEDLFSDGGMRSLARRCAYRAWNALQAETPQEAILSLLPS